MNELSQTLFWLADNMDVWAKPMAMALACFLIGLFHLVAIGLQDR